MEVTPLIVFRGGSAPTPLFSTMKIRTIPSSTRDFNFIRHGVAFECTILLHLVRVGDDCITEG